MGMAQSEDDPTTTNLCCSPEVGFGEFGEHCASPTRKLLRIWRSCWSTASSWITLCPGSSKETNQSHQMFNIQPCRWRMVSEWVMGYSMCRSELWLSKWTCSGHIPLSHSADKTKPPGHISHGRGNNKTPSGKPELLHPQQYHPRGFCSQVLWGYEQEYEAETFNITKPQLRWKSPESPNSQPNGMSPLGFAPQDLMHTSPAEPSSGASAPAGVDTLHCGLLRLKITQVILHDNQTSGVFPPKWHLYDHNGRCK